MLRACLFLHNESINTLQKKKKNSGPLYSATIRHCAADASSCANIVVRIVRIELAAVLEFPNWRRMTRSGGRYFSSKVLIKLACWMSVQKDGSRYKVIIHDAIYIFLASHWCAGVCLVVDLYIRIKVSPRSISHGKGWANWAKRGPIFPASTHPILY